MSDDRHSDFHSFHSERAGASTGSPAGEGGALLRRLALPWPCPPLSVRSGAPRPRRATPGHALLAAEMERAGALLAPRSRGRRATVAERAAPGWVGLGRTALSWLTASEAVRPDP